MWYDITLLKSLWAIASKKDILWIRWVLHDYYLKGRDVFSFKVPFKLVCRSIWCKNNASPAIVICLRQTKIDYQCWIDFSIGELLVTLCRLCDCAIEYRNHLFKHCHFTQDLQQELSRYLGNIRWESSFDEEVS